MNLRRPIAAMAATLLLLTGCANTFDKKATEPVTDGFTCQTTICYRDMELQGQLTRDTTGKMTIAFSLPKTLEGVTIGWNGTDMTMELGGMSIAVPAEQVPQGALVQRLLRLLSADHGKGTLTDDGYALSGEIEGDVYTLLCDKVTGLPMTLSMPSEGLEVTFTEVALTENTN